MKTHFRNQTCPDCHTSYDGYGLVCPHCGKPSSDPSVKKFKNFLPFHWARQLILFLVGWGGFQLIAAGVQLIDLLAMKSLNPSWGTAELTAYTKTAQYAALVNFISYGILGIAMCFIVWKGWKNIFRSFANWKAPLIGLAGFAIMFAFSNVYSMIVSAILKAQGIEYSTNDNENTLRAIIAVYPALSLLVFGVVGPLCEELAYRAGLFSFLGRISKVAAYLISALVFGLIHFDFASIGTNQFFVELYNLPTYMVAGAILGAVYDFGGFAASFTTHTFNNLFSIIITMVQLQNGK